jgi:TatD DNase family protein
MFLIDSHAHIDGPEFDVDRNEVIKRAGEAGVKIILNVCSGDPNCGSLERAVALGEKCDNIFVAIGVHPHEARLFDSSVEKRIADLMGQSGRIIAWGEIGLDFHYDNSPREIQREVFRRQLRLAREARMPVVVHTREAEVDTIEILQEEWGGADLPGIMHCFGGTMNLAQAALDLGFMISFSGIATFKSATELRTVIEQVPLDRILVETDCPYLTPVPFRGKRNEPAYVVEVARCVAGVRQLELATLAAITTKTFSRLFDLELSQ